MNDLYTEVVVKKKVTAMDTMIKFGAIAAIIAFAVVGLFMPSTLMLFFAMVGGVVCLCRVH